ncbi:MAG: peptidase [Acidobacteria bacterium]|nr:MAG: peptidase [Acidobacteriota bacterium]REK02147.1 MAG: peptidase [Acidobacteriota bacterium]REK14051.1 MAG: peptidase [Acidobacteriota bacterium]REK42046.1 MAG: peptidase [Acidobacteriota bacterium]
MDLRDRRPVIGRREIADFPELDIVGLPVKIDTGAYNSSFHCEHYRLKPDGLLEVVFLDPEHTNFTGKVHKFSDFRKKTVKSSNGQAELRFMISTTISFAGNEFEIDVSLAKRGDMRFTVLVGRKFLKSYRFLVDPLKKELLSPRKMKRKR